MDPNTPQPQTIQDPYYSQDSGGIFANKMRLIVIILIVLFVLIGIFFVVWFLFFRDTNSSDEKVTLTYWGVWEDANVLQPVFDEFTREHPNITIQYEKQDIKTLGDYVARLRTRVSQGDGPDIMRFHSSWLPQIGDILLPFPKDVIDETGLEKDYFTVVQNDLKRNGAYYGLPLSIDTLALYVNNDLLANIGASPPKDWNELDDLATQLTSVDEEGNINIAGAALGTYDNIAHAPDILSLLLFQTGIVDIGSIKTLDEDQLESISNVLRFYTGFANVQGAKVWDQAQENSKAAFAGGELAMYFGYSWDMYEIDAFNPNLNYSIVPVPVIPDVGTDIDVASYWVEGVSQKSQHPEAAFELIKFLGKNETLQKIYESQAKLRGVGSPYPKKSLAELVKNNDKVYPFLIRADNAYSTPFSSDTYDEGMNDSLSIYMGNAIRSIINDNTSYESAVETLWSGVTQVMSKYE